MARLKPQYWLDAYRARLAASFIPCYVVKKGDPDAGSIFIRIADDKLFAPEYSFEEDAQIWTLVAQGEGIAGYLATQAKFDPDYWLLDVENGGEKYLMNEGL